MLAARSSRREPDSCPFWGECGRRCCGEASRLCGFFNNDVFDISIGSQCGNHDPDDSGPVVEIAFGVDKQVGKIIFITVVVTPPDQGAVADVPVVFINELLARCVFDSGAECVVNVVIPAKFLDHLPVQQSELD